MSKLKKIDSNTLEETTETKKTYSRQTIVDQIASLDAQIDNINVEKAEWQARLDELDKK